MTPAPHDDTLARPRRLFLLAALLLHLAFAGASAWYTPAFEGPDENDHVYYAYQLHRTGQLPLISGTAAELGRSNYDEAILGHHPPLYYALAGLLLGDTLPSWRVNPEFSATPAPTAGDADATDPTPTSTLHKLHGFDERAPVAPEIHRLWAMRGLSVLCGLISITLVWLLGRRLFPERPSVAGAAAVLLACTPQWVWVHGCVENGNLATTLSLGALLALTDAVCRRHLGWQRGLGIGLLVGLALLTKLTSVFLLPLCGLVWGLGLLAWPERRRTLVSGLVALLVITAVAGWFFWRNQQLYGDPLALAAHQQAFASNRLEAIAAALGRPLDEVRFEYLTEDFPLRTARSAVAGFGWQIVRAPIAEWLALLVVAAGLLGWLVRPHRLLRGRALAVMLQAAAALLVIAGLVRFNATFVQPQGRYLLPAYGPVAILLAAGLAVLLAEGERSRLRLRWLGVAPPLLAAGVLWFIGRPALDMTQAQTDDRHFAALSGGMAAVPEPPTIELLEPADDAVVDAPPTLRWRCDSAPEDALYTVHLQLPSGLILGSFETAGAGVAATRWQIPQAIWQQLPAGPEPLRWRVRRLPDRAAGESVADVQQSTFRSLRRE